MEAESDFIEKVAEILNHTEFDMGFVLKGLCDLCVEKMEKDADEKSARVWLLLTQAQKLLQEN
jgi:hypothetical protein